MRKPARTTALVVLAAAGPLLAGCTSSTPSATSTTSSSAAQVVAASRAFAQAAIDKCTTDGQNGVAFDALGCGIRDEILTDAPGIDASLGASDASGHAYQMHYVFTAGLNDPDTSQVATGAVTWTVGVDVNKFEAIDQTTGQAVVPATDYGASDWTLTTCNTAHATNPSAAPETCAPASD